MSESILSQQEIDNLLRQSEKEKNGQPVLTEAEKDLLGEVGNISMSTAATALSTILAQKKVEITTPNVEITTLPEFQKSLTIPNVAIQVKFVRGLGGSNVLLIGVPDASIIADLMMGGDGRNPLEDLSEMEISAVSEAMNQMIGSASTSLASIMKRDIEITPPDTQIWYGDKPMLIEGFEPDQPIVKVAFRMTVEDLIDSQIMQIFNLETVKDITTSLLGGNNETQEKDKQEPEQAKEAEPANYAPRQPEPRQEAAAAPSPNAGSQAPEQPVTVQKPVFGELENKPSSNKPSNIDLIMDVPLEFSVVLGKTKRTIREILALSPGSVVELDKLAEEPLEIYVNGKLLAQGEVVVINENFGIRITSIINPAERVKNLK